MKKKHRDITIGEKTYGYTIKSYGKEHSITIWYDKKPIHTKTVRVTEITPSLVKEIIIDNKL